MTEKYGQRFNFRNNLRLGFIVNPLAGVGGPNANKGSDDSDVQRQAMAGNIPLRAPARAAQFLEALCHEIPANSLPLIITAPGRMGEEYLHALNISYQLAGPILSDIGLSSAADTIDQIHAMLLSVVDLVLFVGGDGTARDICSVVGTRIPVLGIPSGVKMHSGVFAVTPEAAAQVVARMLCAELASLVEGEVRDIDEQAFREGRVRSRHYGDMLVPSENQFVQHVKQGGMEVEELVLLDIAAEIRERLERIGEPAVVIFGPGSTTYFIQQEFGAEATLLGVDVLYFERGAACYRCEQDVNAGRLEALLANWLGPVRLIITAIGGQGHIIGRGNQQITAALLASIKKANTWVVATKTKLEGLTNRPLLIDSGDPQLDKAWSGFISVICGYQDTLIYPLGLESTRRRPAVVDLVATVIACCEQKLDGSTDSRRLFHGRGGTIAHLQWCCIDWFYPVVFITFFKEPHAGFESILVAELRRVCDRFFWGHCCLMVQRRYLDGAPIDVVNGSPPDPWLAQRGNVRFLLSAQQQNVGFFLDIEPARCWIESQVAGKRVLNLFAYTCAFSVIALAAGAEHVVNIDMSKSAMNVGRANHRYNHLDSVKAKFLPHNIFKSWGKLKREGPYDVIVIDPPSYQKGSFIAQNDYVKVLRKMPELMDRNGCFLACLNAPEVTASEFKQLLDEHCSEFEFVERLASHSDFADADSERALKMLVYRKVISATQA